MEIELKKSDISYGDLEIGDTFINEIGPVYMKTPYFVHTDKDDVRTYVNCVDLSNGFLRFLREDHVVIKINCKLIEV